MKVSSQPSFSYNPSPPAQYGYHSSDTTLTVYDPCLPSDSSLSSIDIRLEPNPMQGALPIGSVTLNEPFLPRGGSDSPQT